MWRWATFSEPGAGATLLRAPGGRGRTATLLASLAVSWSLPSQGKVLLTMDEALQQAFPGCDIERRTVYLTEAQLEQARELAGVEIEGALVVPYLARRDGELVGTAYFDTHRVRTLPETLMIVVDADDRLRRVEVLSFREPEDYLPPAVWYRELEGETLDEDLRVKRDIHAITGATLTVRATAAAVRRILAIHQVLHQETP